MENSNPNSLIDAIVLRPLRFVFNREKSEHISKNNHLANSYIYSIDEIVSKDNRLIKAAIEIPIGDSEHEE